VIQRHKPTQTPDWALMIERLESVSVTRSQMAEAMGAQITDRMIRFYRTGMQPAYFRGVGLVTLWTETTGEPVPMTELIRGHRASRHQDTGPRVQNLPAWPPSVPVAVKPVKRRKAKAEA